MRFKVFVVVVALLATVAAAIPQTAAYRSWRLSHSGNVFYDLEAFDKLCSQAGGFTIRVVKSSSFNRPFACVEPVINDPGERCLTFGYVWDITTETCSKEEAKRQKEFGDDDERK